MSHIFPPDVIVNHLFPISCTHDRSSLTITLLPTPLQLLKEINRTSISRALRIRRQASQSDPRAYVTAGYKTLPLQFTLGDGQNYGDFRNRPLQNGQEYVFFVLALLDLSENVSKTHLEKGLPNQGPRTNMAPPSSRQCTPPALIPNQSPPRTGILSQSWTRKRVSCGWWVLSWLWSSSSALSSPFCSSRGKSKKKEKGRDMILENILKAEDGLGKQ